MGVEGWRGGLLTSTGSDHFRSCTPSSLSVKPGYKVRDNERKAIISLQMFIKKGFARQVIRPNMVRELSCSGWHGEDIKITL